MAVIPSRGEPILPEEMIVLGSSFSRKHMHMPYLRTIIGCLAVACLTLGAVTSEEQKAFNKYVALPGGNVIRGEEIVQGMSIPLHSVIVTIPVLFVPEKPETKRFDSEISVAISFRREDVDKILLQEFLRKPENFPFGDPCLETVLTNDSLYLTIHKGVAFHLRNDIPGAPTLNAFVSRVFVSDDVKGVVTKVQGKALVSRDSQLIKEGLSQFWSQCLTLYAPVEETK